jgi:hypothetical protein
LQHWSTTNENTKTTNFQTISLLLEGEFGTDNGNTDISQKLSDSELKRRYEPLEQLHFHSGCRFRSVRKTNAVKKAKHEEKIKIIVLYPFAREQ